MKGSLSSWAITSRNPRYIEDRTSTMHGLFSAGASNGQSHPALFYPRAENIQIVSTVICREVKQPRAYTDPQSLPKKVLHPETMSLPG